MPNEGRLSVRLRLEDLIALAFFFINFAMRALFRGLNREFLSPADVLVIIPAVTLLLAKELVHYFVVDQKEATGKSRAGLGDFARPYWEIIRDWFPFLVILLMYYTLWGDATHLLITTDRDAALIAWDQRLFGIQACVAIERFVTPPLTAWMEFSYFFHVLNIPIVACFVYLARPRTRFREMMTGLVVVTFFGLLGYLLVPAIGPLYTLRHQFSVPLSQPLSVFNRQVEFLDFARIRRDVFPSMHVAISFLAWMYAYRNSKRLFFLLAPFVLSLWVSTVYLRYHYLVDVLAGLVLAPLCFWFATGLFKRFGEVQFSLPLPAKGGKATGRPESAEREARVAGKIEGRP